MAHVNQKKEDDDEVHSFFEYTFEIASDVILGMALGILINSFSNYLEKVLHLGELMKMIIQIFLCCIILYLMKIESKHLYSSWRGSANYGIVFTTVFFSVQKNLVDFLENITLKHGNTKI